MIDKPVAIVTGGNRGIGREVCRQLASRGLHVLLTARNETGGSAAAAELAAESLDVTYVRLDVTDGANIDELVRTIDERYGRLDVLVNNAAILVDENESALQVDVSAVRETLETNLLGPLYLCQKCIPLMRRNGFGRIVNLSSGMGAFSEMGGGYLGYRLSKTALNAMTVIFANETSGSNILINTVSPGWVRTEMGGRGAPRSVEQGADTVVWLATLPDSGPSGRFFRDRKEIPW